MTETDKATYCWINMEKMKMAKDGKLKELHK